MGDDMVITAADMVYLDVPRICQCWMEKSVLCS
jgi:hypothetical protein